MTDLETAIMIKNMARETVKQMTAKVKNATYSIVGDTVWYEDDTYRIPLQSFRGKNRKFIEGAIEEEKKAGNPSAKEAIRKSGEYYKK